jgi:hypothetical protein
MDTNIWLSAGQRNRKEAFYQPQVTRRLADHHIVESNVGMFPLYLRENVSEAPDSQAFRSNLTARAATYLPKLSSGESQLFRHAVACLHAPAYRQDNAGALRQDWPRVPLPKTRERLEASAALGRQLADLLDPETQVPGVTSGSIRPELRVIGNAARVGGGALKPREFEVTSGWGHAGKGGVTMPGQGKRIARAYAPDEEAAVLAGTKALGMIDGDAFDVLGRETGDVYLSDAAYWSNIPAKVWDYTIGGYQVIKKWLSYRELDLLGRALTADEIRYVTDMARRIAAILLLHPALDANYRAVVADTYKWPYA